MVTVMRIGVVAVLLRAPQATQSGHTRTQRNLNENKKAPRIPKCPNSSHLISYVRLSNPQTFSLGTLTKRYTDCGDAPENG